MANVTVIPAKPRQELQGLEATAKLRVCAYCRVSTDNEDQLSSYQAQVDHYLDISITTLPGNSAEFLPMKVSAEPTLRNG